MDEFGRCEELSPFSRIMGTEDPKIYRFQFPDWFVWFVHPFGDGRQRRDGCRT